MKIDNLIKIIKQLVQDAFYGELLIKFEKGGIKIIRKTENIKEA